MRKAEIDDVRRALDKRHINAAPSFESIEVSNLPGFTRVSILPRTGFLAICGGTGIGKTALLEMIYLALSRSDHPLHSASSPRLGNATISLHVNYQGQEFRSQVTAGQRLQQDPGSFPNGVRVLSMAERTSIPQTFFSNSNIDVLKEGIDPFVFDALMLEVVSFACRKAYERVRVFEIESASDVILPFFEVKECEDEYDSRSMATGEHSLLYLAWALQSLDPYSILLIEEPEAFLPPINHEGAFALIAKYAVKNHIAVILTTHSRSIAGELPPGALISLKRSAGLTTIPVGAESRIRILSRLGLLRTVNAIFFVEDDLGREVLNEIIASSGFHEVSSVEIVICKGGAGSVRTALQGIPDGISLCKFVGVLDGDMRAEASQWNLKHNLIFLPFRRAMEEEFLAAAERKTNLFAKELGRDPGALEDSLAECKGSDYHQRFVHVAEKLGFNYVTFANLAMKRWVKGAHKKAAVQKVARELAHAIKVTLP